jgi:hypothetical protein
MAGRLFAALARAVGAPLPLRPLVRTPAAVLVTEGAAHHVQVRTRAYHEPGQLPEVVRSPKRFAGPIGLEECVGAGIGMALAVHVGHRAFVVRSDRYLVTCGSYRVRLPRWLTPGDIEVVHRQEREHRFSFGLTVKHP